jgi:uncharacterized protein DUF4258
LAGSKEGRDKKTIQRLAGLKRVEWKIHSLKRLFERDISRQSVFNVLKSGEIIETYQQENLLPAFLILGYDKKDPLHIVVALDQENRLLWIITVYKPTLEEWEAGFKIRRKK